MDKRCLRCLLLLILPMLAHAGTSVEDARDRQIEAYRQQDSVIDSSALGEKLMALIERRHQKAQSIDIWQQADMPEALEIKAIEEIFAVRKKRGDSEAAFQLVSYLHWQCQGFFEKKIKHLYEPICSAVDKDARQLAGKGADPRAMLILAQMYERGLYLSQSNYSAGEWNAKVAEWAISHRQKDLAYVQLEKVDRLYPKYPNLEKLRQRALDLK